MGTTTRRRESTMHKHCREILQRTRDAICALEPTDGRVRDPGTDLRPGDGIEVWWGGSREWVRGVVEDDGNGGSLGVRWWDGVLEKVAFRGEVWRTVQGGGAGPSSAAPSSAAPADAVKPAAPVGARVGSEVANGVEKDVELRVEEIESEQRVEGMRLELLEQVAGLEARLDAYFDRGRRERALVEAGADRLAGLAGSVLKKFEALTQKYETLKEKIELLETGAATAEHDANDVAPVEEKGAEKPADAHEIVSETIVPVAVAGKVTAMLAGTASGRRADGENAADLIRNEWDALVRKETESLLESLTKESEQKTPEEDVSKLDSTWLTTGVSHATLKSARECNYSKLTPTEWEFEADVLAQVSHRVRAACEGAKGDDDVLTNALKDKTGCASWPFPPTSEKGATPMDVEK